MLWVRLRVIGESRPEGLVDNQEAKLLQVNGVGAGLDGDTAAAASRIIEALGSWMPAGQVPQLSGYFAGSAAPPPLPPS